MTFVDVGSHIGHFALVAASVLQGNGHVYAFEPDPITFSFLQKNVDVNGYEATIFPFPKAVADTFGETVLYSGRRDRLDNAIIADVPAVGKHSHMVEVTSLDAFFAQRGWPPVHIIKIDVEGAEYRVMRGMVELSSRNRDLQIIMEFHPANIRASGVSFEQFFHALMALGFSKVFMITSELVPVAIPADIAVLLQQCQHGPHVNILCQR
jgi:FkbM family methyltransferase